MFSFKSRSTTVHDPVSAGKPKSCGGSANRWHLPFDSDLRREPEQTKRAAVFGLLVIKSHTAQRNLQWITLNSKFAMIQLSSCFHRTFLDHEAEADDYNGGKKRRTAQIGRYKRFLTIKISSAVVERKYNL